MDARDGSPARPVTILADLVDLVLPASCVGCASTGVRLRYGVCGRCVDALLELVPAATRPDPEPPGLPPVVGLGRYDGVLREVLLAYKERGRHPLAAPLGALLAEAVAVAAPACAVLLVPVPSTGRAARRRHGDHVVRLARHAARRLTAAGRPTAVHRALRALPRPDSAGLSAAERAMGAQGAFRVRRLGLARLRAAAAPARVVLVDDLVTTGATLVAAARALGGAGVPVAAAAVLAATVRRDRGSPRRTSPSGITDSEAPGAYR